MSAAPTLAAMATVDLTDLRACYQSAAAGPSGLDRVLARQALAEVGTELQRRAALAALKAIANCKADSQGGTTLGSYEMGLVRDALAMGGP